MVKCFEWSFTAAQIHTLVFTRETESGLQGGVLYFFDSDNNNTLFSK